MPSPVTVIHVALTAEGTIAFAVEGRPLTLPVLKMMLGTADAQLTHSLLAGQDKPPRLLDAPLGVDAHKLRNGG